MIVMWSGSILKDEAFENVFESLLKNSIQGGKIGDGEPTTSAGQGELAGATDPPKPNKIQEEEEEDKIVDAVTQRLKKHAAKRLVSINVW